MSTEAVRVLYIVSSLRSCGPINQLYGLIKNLDKDIFRVKIITLSREKENSMINAFLSLGVEIVAAELSKAAMHFSGKSFLQATARGFCPNIIHTSGIRPDYYAEKWLGDYLHCATIREYAYDDYPIEYGKLKGTIMAAAHLRVLSNIKYPVCCSFAIVQRLNASHGLRCSVIQNGVDDERYYSNLNPKEKIELRKKLDLPIDKKIYIFSGLLIERKDPITLIKAFNGANISAAACLVILGDGPMYEMCERVKNDSVFLRGHVNNVLDYLHASDIFVSASNSEGLPNSVLEAMSASLPVLLSDIEPHKEILKNDYEAGETFTTGDTASLTDKFRKSLSWALSDRGKAACNIIKNHFSARIMSKCYQQMYLRMLQDAPGKKSYKLEANYIEGARSV